MRKLFSALLCTVAFGASSIAAAANLIVDGNFSAATLSPYWTQSGDTSAQTLGHDYSETPLSHQFNMVFSDGAYEDFGILGQQITLDSHLVYRLDFDLQRYHASSDSVVNDSKVLLNGKVIWQQTNTGGDWTHITISNLWSNKGQVWLQFFNKNYFDYTALDNVSVYATGLAVPEPASVMMLPLGLGVLLLVGRAKRRRPS
ncbi:PEP-CTERM sorting domain-containing protein [Rugamonas aquatica]|uniref:PEP-CTERM sorting domain-containing protein n=1 Tax=Rugamonas aquatica TaxID=2743357 RepID=A0A6A7N934_9BURK|nr:PEP-CTERM sorting domain-containing protein [Rugamonas aquatica]MQA41227.1 PEP-CTERM sorting domain-containing protein [Rugamonas aquatica]